VVIKWDLYLVLVLSVMSIDASCQVRLESEFKLSIPGIDQESVQKFVDDEFAIGEYALDSMRLMIEHAD